MQKGLDRYKVGKDKSRESLANIYDTSIAMRIILPYVYDELMAKFTVRLMEID